MTQEQVRAILGGLNSAGVRYLVAGGLAVVAHGYLRLTVDLDLVVALERDNLLLALQVLRTLGYTPRLPVKPEEFADEATRRRWIDEKQMVVFPMISPDAEQTAIDLFVEIPFNFETEYAAADWLEPMPGLKAPIVTLDCLMTMKSDAGRPKDLADLHQLRRIKEARNEQA